MDEILKGADHNAKHLLADMLADLMLNDENVPEYFKIDIRIITAARKFEEKFHSAFMSFCEPIVNMAEAEAACPERKEALEYLKLMEAGLDSFLAAHPAHRT